jgi:hypothetical protein
VSSGPSTLPVCVPPQTTRRTAAGGGGCWSGSGSPTTDARAHEGDGVEAEGAPAPASGLETAAVWDVPSSSVSSRVSSVPGPWTRSFSFSSFCSGGHGTPGAGISPRSQRPRRSARPSIHGPAFESAQPPPPSTPLVSLSPLSLLLLSLSRSSPRVLLLVVEAQVQVQVQVPPSEAGRFSGETRSRSSAVCWSGTFVPRMVILSSVRGASHGLIMLQIAVKDVGPLMMISWPIL